MANESTYALISDVLPDIWEAALYYIQHSFVMPSLIRNFGDQTGMVPRKITEYIETAVTDNLGETTDLTPVAFDRDLLRTITPKEIGKQFLITDRRVESDLESVVVDAVRDLGYTMGKKLETDLLGNFANLTGGTAGSTTAAFSTTVLFNARSALEKAGVPGPYVAVIHPWMYLDIFSDFTSLSNAAPLDIRNLAQAQYYTTSIADISVVVSSLIPLTAVVAEVQDIDITGTPTGGTFTLTFRNATTAAIAYDADAPTVETAIDLLETLADGDVEVTGTNPNFVFTHQGNLIGGVELWEFDGTALTGGSSPTLTVTDTTDGTASARGALFNREAMVLDMRRNLRIEPDRDPSLRSAELNATMIYGHGVWRSNWGVEMLSDATNPLSS